MKCPYCSYAESKVIDKRETGEDQEITRRRRECLQCEKRFTTYEAVEEYNIMLVKKDGRREAFDRKKLFSGVARACEKRPVSVETMENIVSDIESYVRGLGQSEIKTTLIGEKIMEKLVDVDKVAYIRFASVYREFADIDSFSKELNKLLKKNSSKHDDKED